MQAGRNSPPSLQTWEKLYREALKFKELGCWNWMWDSDIFGVQSPQNNEIDYCCIVGRAKKHFGLAVY